ncbi:hypothetical protein B0T24DRAFT_652230 [Lasiosphaeria ovina]|uniref:Uncharacterized protein n=1 Tax=Lasiosphaeria ovina TaxID=92902 RepID=A0AAE0JVH0_9PEZI|nr:hypothetical protein B0T24DRAFT_652230 [Lasiosphaeria ovina]
MEVKALSFIREGTSIPVPNVQAWGPAASNPLGLGPFIIRDFIDGVSLSDILEEPNAERPTRLMREDISNDDIEAVYRQLANFLLQLFELDIDRIGSLPSDRTGSNLSTSRTQLLVPKSSIPNLINANYDHGKVKLICDKLGLADLIVRSKEDLAVVGVVDLKWLYIGPAQLFGSAPCVWDYDNGEPPKVAVRYFRYLEIFQTCPGGRRGENARVRGEGA